MSLFYRHRLQKRYARFLLWIFLWLDYKRRWLPRMGGRTSFDHYVRVFLEQKRAEHRMKRIWSEVEYFKGQAWRYAPYISWLPTERNREPPYVCKHCKAVASLHGAPTIYFTGVRLELPDGTHSPGSYLAILCTRCRKVVEVSEYLKKGVEQELNKLNPRQRKFGTYSLTYTATYGPYSRAHEQIRERGTHALIKERPEVARFGSTVTPDVSMREISCIEIDRVGIEPGHPLYNAVLDAILRYEQACVEKFVHVP